MSTRHVLASAAAAATILAAVPAGPAAAAAADYQQVIDLTFPTPPHLHFSDGYDAPRSGGRVHKATDIMGPKMAPLYATTDGVICRLDDGAEDHYGRHLTLCGDDGRRYRYLHLNNDTPGTDDGKADLRDVYAPYIREGLRVVAGQHVAYMGDSGNAEATAPHLHLDIFDDRVLDPYGDNRVNPYPSLVDALRRGDVSDGSPFHAKPTARVAGPDRVGTAIALSRAAFKGSEWVVVAPAESAAETIVAGPLAGRLDAPVLTTYSNRLDGRVADEIRRLGATRAVVVGGSLGDGIVDGIAAAGVAPAAIERLGGRNNFQTAVEVAQRVWALSAEAGRDPGRRPALVALGAHPDPTRSWPDALMASYHGAAVDAPVLLVAHDKVPQVTRRALESASSAVVFGGPGALSEEIVTAVRDRVTAVRRLAGTTRFSTATAVVDDLRSRGLVRAKHVWVATGHNWPDAVTAGPAMARLGDVFVLVDGRHGGGDRHVGRWLAQQRDAITAGRVVGGPGAVSAQARVDLARRIT